LFNGRGGGPTGGGNLGADSPTNCVSAAGTAAVMKKGKSAPITITAVTTAAGITETGAAALLTASPSSSVSANNKHQQDRIRSLERQKRSLEQQKEAVEQQRRQLDQQKLRQTSAAAKQTQRVAQQPQVEAQKQVLEVKPKHQLQKPKEVAAPVDRVKEGEGRTATPTLEGNRGSKESVKTGGGGGGGLEVHQSRSDPSVTDSPKDVQGRNKKTKNSRMKTNGGLVVAVGELSLDCLGVGGVIFK